MKLFVVLLALAVATASANTIAWPGFPEGRIINGQEAEAGSAPFIVSLQTTSNSHFCAGSILSEKVVITAAHCAIYNQFQVVAAAHSRTDKTTTQVRKALLSRTTVHESYGGGVGPNDIALIFLEEPLDLSALARDGSLPVASIDLPSIKLEAVDSGVLFGWGRDNSGALPDKLQTLDVDILDYSNCKAAMPGSNSLASSNICSYTAGTADGACNGDSGGPLVNRRADGTFQLVGIVSWGYTPCLTTQYPSVYTSTLAHKSWIDEHWNDFE